MSSSHMAFVNRLREMKLRRESDELLSLDFLRLIASVGVVGYHYRYYLWLPADSWLDRLDPTFARQWVDLFFVISGFVIAYIYSRRIVDRQTFVDYFLRRIARLVPLHWATLAAYAAIGLAVRAGVGADSPEHYDWSCFLPNMLLLHSLGVCQAVSFNTVSWSISAEMAMYLMFPALSFLAFATRGWGLVALAALAVTVLSAVSSGPAAGDEGFWLSWASHFGVLRAFPSFALGVGLFSLRHIIARLPFAQEIMLGCLVLFVVLGLLGAHPLVSLSLVYGTAIAGIASDTQGRTNAVVRAWGVGGQLTYSIYMLHPIIATVVMSFGKKVLHMRGWATDLWLIVAVVALTAASFVSLHYFEQPTRRWLTRSRRRKIEPAYGAS